MNKDKEDDSSKEYNVFRDSIVRYVGYANEVGESFRPLIPVTFVLSSYFISASYVFCDVANQGHNAYLNRDVHDPNYGVKIAKETAKSFIWQVLATELLPGAIIFTSVQIAQRYVFRGRFGKGLLGTWGPTAVGLSIIPFLPYTVDPFVDRYIFKV